VKTANIKFINIIFIVNWGGCSVSERGIFNHLAYHSHPPFKFLLLMKAEETKDMTAHILDAKVKLLKASQKLVGR